MYSKRSNETACARQRPRECREGSLLLLLSTASARAASGQWSCIHGALVILGPEIGLVFAFLTESTVSYICTWTVPQPPNPGKGAAVEGEGVPVAAAAEGWSSKAPRGKPPINWKGQRIDASGSRIVECLAWRVVLVEKRGGGRGGKNRARKDARSFCTRRLWWCGIVHR